MSGQRYALQCRCETVGISGDRLEREQQVWELWQAGERDTAAMVRTLYPELPSMVHGIAQRQVLAHLEHLEQIEEIEPDATNAER